ncbi:MAG: hypothetical protein ACKOGA_00700, partial [Planctomycetaceae bacterium]
ILEDRKICGLIASRQWWDLDQASGLVFVPLQSLTENLCAGRLIGRGTRGNWQLRRGIGWQPELIGQGPFALFMPGQQPHLLAEGQVRMPRPEPTQIGNSLGRLPELNQLVPRIAPGHVSVPHCMPMDVPLRSLLMVFPT